MFDVRNWMETSIQDDVEALHYLSSFSTPVMKERWTFPMQGWWKVNCVATWANGKAAMTVVVCDDDGLLVMACSKLPPLFSAYEAKMKTIEWAVTLAAIKPWNKLIFSSDAMVAVNKIKSSKIPSRWHTKESVICIRVILISKGWELTWNARSSNLFADSLAKMTLANNFLFSSSNFGFLSKDLSDVYTSDLMGRFHV